MNDTFLELKVSKAYEGGFHLEVDAAFPRGVTAIFGPSGSGKTTILSCIAGLDSPDKGEIHLQGTPLFSSKGKLNTRPDRRHVGYMFQENLLFPQYNVWENIQFGYKLTPPERRRIHPEQLVELMELGSLVDRRPQKLSTGERQRVALARALATSPDLLLLDEPLSSLDIGLRGRVLRYLKDIHRSLAIPMVYVSHSISEVLAIADMALVVSNGRQLAFDAPHKVLLEPFVHSLVDTGSLENLLDLQIVETSSRDGLSGARLGDDAVLWLPAVSPQVRPGDTISAAIRAGDIMIAVDRPGRISARNILEARIQGIHKVESSVLLYADVGRLLLVEITPDALDSLGLFEGQGVFLVIKSSSIAILD